jgi:hypothetical protein
MFRTSACIGIIKKKMNLEMSLYTILQAASVSLFEKTSILEAFQNFEIPPDNNDACIQLNLIEL